MNIGTQENFSPTNIYQYEEDKEDKEEYKSSQLIDFPKKNAFSSFQNEKMFITYNKNIDESFAQNESDKMELEDSLNSPLNINNNRGNIDQSQIINLEPPSITQNDNISNAIITQPILIGSHEQQPILSYEDSLSYITQNLSNLRDLVIALSNNTNLAQEINTSFHQLNTFNITLSEAVNAIQTQIPQSQQQIQAQLNEIKRIIESNTALLQKASCSQIESRKSKMKRFLYGIAKNLETFFGKYLKNPDFHIFLCFIINIFFFKYLLGLIPDMTNKEEGYLFDWLSTSRQAHLLLGVNIKIFYQY